MNWTLFGDITAAVLMIGGSLMSLSAAIGMLKFPDVLSRMHSAAKPQVLGLLMMLCAVAIKTTVWQAIPVLALIWIMMLLTNPVSAHMVGRAAYRSKHLKRATLIEDDLEAVVKAAEDAEDHRAPRGEALHHPTAVQAEVDGHH